MPVSTIPELCDAIVSEINDATFSSALAAERVFAPKKNVKDMGEDPAALVVPNSVELNRLSRSYEQKKIVVHVAIQQKMADTDTESVDDLINLSQEVLAFFRGKSMEDVPDMLWTSGDNPTVFSGEHYDEFLVFTALVALTYLQAQG